MMNTFVRSDGVRLRYLDDGQGTSVLLMPGTAGTHDIYDEQVNPLRDAGYRVVRLDREGRGQSDWGKYQFTSDWSKYQFGAGEARDAWAILDRLGIDRTVLVGRSSGSGVIRQMYLTQPDRVLALVSIDSDYFGKFNYKDFHPRHGLGGPVSDEPLDAGLDPRFDSETVKDYHRNKAALATINVLWEYPSDLNTKARLDWFEQLKVLTDEVQARPKNPAEEIVTEPAAGAKWWCEVPLLVFAAGRGRIGQDDPESYELKQRLPSENAALVTVKNSGHWINLEAAELFNRELVAFLDSVVKSDGAARSG